MMKAWKWLLSAGLLLAVSLPLRAQEGAGDVVYVPTPQTVVETMLKMAKVGSSDFLIDLGSGDGRMVLTAVTKFGARGGFGVDLDTVLLKVSNDAAQRAGVADRVKFIDQNLFDTDLSQATVITTYLLPQMNDKLMPKFLSLRPGTRIVIHDYHMSEWIADEQDTLIVPEKTVGNPGYSYVYLYIVPAKAGGHWRSEFPAGTNEPNWEFDFTQKIQMLEGIAQAGTQKIGLSISKVLGDKVDFSYFAKAGDASSRREFSGTVSGDKITGMLRIGTGAAQKQLPWTATRTSGGDAK
jgi:hypothetical protein